MGTLKRYEYGEVEALKTGRGRQVNTTCIVYRLGETLVDTGPPNQWRKIRTFIKERSVDRVLLTHFHEDHCGNARRIHKKTGGKIYVHESGENLYRNISVPLYRRLVWGKPRGKLAPEILGPRMEVSRDLVLQPIHSPGHSADMTCFHEPNRGWLFSGDLYISSRPKFMRQEEDPNQEIESLRNVLKLDFETLFCSHRGMIADGKEALKKKLSYLVAIREQVKHYRDKGYTAREISKRLLGREQFIFYYSFGAFSKRNFIHSFSKYHTNKQNAQNEI